MAVVTAVAIAGPTVAIRMNRMRLAAEVDRNHVLAANKDLETVTDFFAGCSVLQTQHLMARM